MKIRERLQKQKTKIQQPNITEAPIEQENTDFSISDIFIDSRASEAHIIELIKNRRNMLIICNKSFDKLIIADYIKSKLKNVNSGIVNTIDANTEDLNGVINIVPNPNIQTVVKILEQTVYGNGSFVFFMNFASYENIVNKLKAVIALNYPNLNADDITALVGAANAVIVYVSKNDNGIFYISQIDEIKSSGNKLETENIYSNISKNQKTEPNIQIKEKKLQKEKVEIVEKTDSKTEQVLVKNKKTQINDKITNNIQNNIPAPVYIPNILEEDEPIEEERGKKPNKYQILKEKAKQKKLSEKK